MRRIVFTAAAARQWIRLAAPVRSRIDDKLLRFARTGEGDVKRLKGRAGVRLRVGDWRVVFFEQGDSIIVAAVGHRSDIYD